MNTLKINIPKGFEVDNFNVATGEVTFKESKKPLLERIKDFDDILKELSDKDVDVKEFRKLEKANVADYILNNQKAVLIAKALNAGWIPNWKDYSEYKYFVYKNYYNSAPSLGYYRYYGSSLASARLCFKNKESVVFAYTTFLEIYESFMNIG